MKSEKFTPGPWVACLNVPAAQIPGHIIKAGYAPHVPIASLWEGGGSEGKPRQIANAQLIAAAPELLAAVEATKAVFDELKKSSRMRYSKVLLQCKGLSGLLPALEGVIEKAHGVEPQKGRRS